MASMDARRSWTVFGIGAGLVALVWFVFGQTLSYGFINFDDPDYVLENRPVSGGLTSSGSAWAFTHVHAGNWHPLTWLSHMLDCQLFGLVPRGHHLTNLLLHTATAILLFLVLLRMTDSIWRSGFVAAVFAIHPLRVESVAWIAERKDVLSGFFFMLTLAAYFAYARRSSALRYAVVVVLFAFGLMAKPMLVTVPFVLLLLDHWPLRRFDQNRRQVLLEKLPLVALAAASAVATVFAQKGAIRTTTDFPVLVRIGNAIISVVAYLRQMIWPSDLTPYYPFAPSDVTAARVLFATAVIVALTLFVLASRSRRYLLVGWGWYLIMLLPVIGIIQVGNQARADRYTYLPQLGLALAVTWLASDLCKRWRLRRVVLGLGGSAILLALVVVAHAQTAYWKESETLWRMTLVRTSNNAMAELNFAEAVAKKGRTDEAIAHLQRALEIQPHEATITGSLGVALFTRGRVQEALRYLRESLEINPRQASVQSSFGVALLESGAPEESLAHLRTAVELEPEDQDAHYNLANTLVALDRSAEAVAEFETALRLNPNDTQTLNNYAWLLATSPDASVRNGGTAVALAQRADSLTGGRRSVIVATLAAAYAEAGQFDQAVQTATRALELATQNRETARISYLRGQLALYQARQPFRQQR